MRSSTSPALPSPWQADHCQYFTRDFIARFCLERLSFPRDLTSIRYLEPAAGRGAFVCPLIPRLVNACRRHDEPLHRLRTVLTACEVDPKVAEELRGACATILKKCDVGLRDRELLLSSWILNVDFLEADLPKGFTHIAGNPPYIRWDAIPKPIIQKYRREFAAFQARADLYVAFIEKSLGLLAPGGQLGLLCPGNWTRNGYGAHLRKTLTERGRLVALIDLSDVESFEQSADAYPSFFVFKEGASGPTDIISMRGEESDLRPAREPVRRTFQSSSAPLLLAQDSMTRFVDRARRKFPNLEQAGCAIRVGSATGCNEVFLGERNELPVERDRLLPFVNARSIRDAEVRWDGTYIVNVFRDDGGTIDLLRYPKLGAYLVKHERALKARAKAGRSPTWWRTIDVLHRAWFGSPKLLLPDISTRPVIGWDQQGYCAGSGLYQIKSREWPLRELMFLLSSGILGVFVGAVTPNNTTGFHRFQKQHLATIPLPVWSEIDRGWRADFRRACSYGDLDAVQTLTARIYGGHPDLLATSVARDWRVLGKQRREASVG